MEPTDGRNWLKRLASIHPAAWFAAGVVVAIFVLLNVPGQLIEGPYIRDSGKYGPHWEDTQDHFEHGWPQSYLIRYPVYGPPFAMSSAWKMMDGAAEFRLSALLLNAAIAVAVVALVGYVVRARKRSLPKFQLTLRGTLLTMAGVAIVCGYYALERARYHEQLRILREIEGLPGGRERWQGGISQRIVWSRGGPTWLRELIGDERMRAFDRVLIIETDGNELELVSQLSSLKTVRILGGASTEELAYLEALPQLEALDLSFAGGGSGADGDENFALPRLPNLRGLNVYEAAFRGDGLENAPRLELLYAPGTALDDEALAKVGTLRDLQALTMGDTKVTDQGMRHLASLEQLEELWMSGEEITDAGVKHLAGLPRLSMLGLGNCRLTDLSIPALSRLPMLKYLNVDDLKLSPKGLAELKQALPNCQINPR